MFAIHTLDIWLEKQISNDKNILSQHRMSIEISFGEFGQLLIDLKTTAHTPQLVALAKRRIVLIGLFIQSINPVGRQ
jgi:hypothetical protein